MMLISKIKKYKASGLKLTPQRLAILDYLDGNKEHPSAETIYKAVRKKFPTMSLATVYNTLEYFKKHGYLQELNLESGKKRFDPETKSHHHLFCIKCKKILDIHVEIPLPLIKLEQKGFEVIKTHMEFWGRCPKCNKK